MAGARIIFCEFSPEEFRLAFDKPNEVYNYLDMVRPMEERRPIPNSYEEDLEMIFSPLFRAEEKEG